jgi:hypothetical protein
MYFEQIFKCMKLLPFTSAPQTIHSVLLAKPTKNSIPIYLESLQHYTYEDVTPPSSPLGGPFGKSMDQSTD